MPAINLPNKHVDAVKYSGTGASNVISSLNFQSDLIWVKERSVNSGGTGSHRVYDYNRGTFGNWMSTDSTGSYTDTASGTLGVVNSTGFTVGTDNDLNDSGGTYVAWCWKAGGTTTSNTSGSVTSSVSKNLSAQFSIASWTHTSSGTYTVGHGLGVAPSFIICKNTNTVLIYSYRFLHSCTSSSAHTPFAPLTRRLIPFGSFFMYNTLLPHTPSGLCSYTLAVCKSKRNLVGFFISCKN